MGVFRSRDCFSAPSDLPSLEPFVLPSCEEGEAVTPTQENPVVVTPLIDPPNIDFGCFPIKTKTTVSQVGTQGIFELITTYSKHNDDPDFCQPIVHARINFPRVTAQVVTMMVCRCVQRSGGLTGDPSCINVGAWGYIQQVNPDTGADVDDPIYAKNMGRCAVCYTEGTSTLVTASQDSETGKFFFYR